eukprot:124709_1
MYPRYYYEIDPNVNKENKDNDNIEDIDEKKQVQNQSDIESIEICDIHDLYNGYVSNAVLIDIRPLKAFETSHISEAINIDPENANKNIKTIPKGRNIIFYGNINIKQNNMDVIQLCLTQTQTRNVKVMNNGYEVFKKIYKFVCWPTDCFSYMLPSVIIPQRVYLGKQKTRMLIKVLNYLNITHIVDVTKTKFPVVTDEIKILKIPLEDENNENIDKYFDEAIFFIDNALLNDTNCVFIHCQMGVSRSASVLLAWLMKSKKYTLVDAYKLCQKCRPYIHPNDGFFEQLIKYETEIFGKSTKEKIKTLKLRENNECIVM